MALSPGTRIGVYEVTAKIGAGGMGEVYRARDTKLDRDVALKVLPEAFTADSERLARFEREAKVLASLNHPNIGAIHGLEESDEGQALVLELIEGPTLADRVAQGPIPLDEALPIATQIAEALEAAHEQGVIHRDLKPANVKVRDDGTVKVLDFGLAKALDTVPDGDPSQSPTRTAAATQMGMIIGTAAYMSPEQARGKPVDKRADIWAFGVVLLEMLTGHRAFEGEDVSLTLSLVLQQEPDWSGLPTALSPTVAVFLRRCLVKDPRQRVHDIADVRLALAGAFDTRTVGGPKISPPTHPLRWWQRPVPGMAALVLAATLGGVAALVSTSGGRDVAETTLPELNLTIVPAPETPLTPLGGLSSVPRVSPDGSSVLFEVNSAGGSEIRARRLDSQVVTTVPGSERVSNEPFWSADSSSVFYPTREEGLVRVRLPDGAPQSVMPLPGFSRGGSESEAGALLVSSLNRLLLKATPESDVETLEFEALGEGRAFYPQFLPGGEQFLFFWMSDERTETEIYLASLGGAGRQSPVLLMTNETAARHTVAGGGQLLFVRGDNLYARQLDLAQRTLVGESRLIQERVGSRLGPIRGGTFSVAQSGLLAWRSGVAALNQVTAYGRSGAVASTTGPPTDADSITLSPDGTRVLAIGSQVTWLLDVGRPGRFALPGSASWWFWSRGGSHILGMTMESGRLAGRLVEQEVAGGGLRELGEYRGIPQDLSPDGTHLLVMDGGVVAQDIENSREEDRRRLVDEGAGASFSSDGQWIVYGTGAGVFVQPFPGPGLRRQIADGPGIPRWRGDGREILFWRGSTVFSIAVADTGGELSFGEPERLFSGLRRPGGSNSSSRSMAVSDDGALIYWPQPVEQPGSDVIHIRTNALDD